MRGVRNERRGNLFISRRLLRSYLPRNDRKSIIQTVFGQALFSISRRAFAVLVGVGNLKSSIFPDKLSKFLLIDNLCCFDISCITSIFPLGSFLVYFQDLSQDFYLYVFCFRFVLCPLVCILFNLVMQKAQVNFLEKASG